MPELPEVETVRRRLLPHLSGRVLREVEVLAAYELVDGAVERPPLLLETVG